MVVQPWLSIIIPIGPAETEFGRLANDLAQLTPAQVELIVVRCEGSAELTDFAAATAQLKDFQLVSINSAVGRAQQMNAGAARAQGQFLWFLHLDSQVSIDAYQALLQHLKQRPEALHYFKLGFSQPCPGYMKLNAGGANLRSRLFGIPFGDQGFCLSKRLFERVRGYPEDAAYGEDHLLVWRVRRAGYKLNHIPQTLWTSPRKYQQQGWLKLTGLYQWLWLRQAARACWQWGVGWLLSERF